MTPILRYACGALLLLCLASGIASAQDISRNGNCEQVENGKPVGWGAYDGVGEWGSLQEGYSGKGAYFVPKPFAPIASGERKGEDYQSAALVLGSADGYTGPNAFVIELGPEARYYRVPPGAAAYRISFWARSEASELVAAVQCWRTDEAGGGDRESRILIAKVPRTPDWTHYEGTVTMPGDARKFAIMFQVYGYRKDGLELGRVCVDEVTVQREEARTMTADDMPRIQIPDKPAVYVGDTPLEDVLAAYRAGDKAAISTVESTLRSANGFAQKPDEWFRRYYKSFEPRGVYTVTCPIHPFKTRYYNDFSWSMDEPWKLVCEHCKAEGRKYYYYPNPDYPDDGNGCAPTDEVWARTHDEAWSTAHRGIPHDHWDGSAHGDGGGKRFYFLGKYYVNAFLYLQGTPAQNLALAWHFATKLFPPDSEEHKMADTYAHKAKVIMLCTARAYLGDDYLAAAEGITPQQFQERMEGFYQASDGGKWKYEKLAGFRPFTCHDVTVGDPLYEAEVKARPYGSYSLYIGAWNWQAGQAKNLLESFCFLRETFTDQEQDLCRMCQRQVVSLPGDREKVALGQLPPAHYLKRGAFEMHIHPYNLETGADNLASSTQLPRLRAGLLLRDDGIMENVALDISYFLRNFFSQDGLGTEGSPTYTGAAYGVTGVMEKLYGMKGNFNQDAPYFDKALGAINMFRMPHYKEIATKLLYYATEDDYFIPWQDSVYSGGRRDTHHYAYMEKYGGGIPENERKYLNVNRGEGGQVSVTFNYSEPLPPMLLHDRRKAILRAGRVEAPTVVSLHYTKACGHLHWPVQDIVVHALGQELASDLGYLGSDHYLRTWIKSYPAHNCVALRTANGDPGKTTQIRGDLRKHFVITPFCQLVDTAEYDAADWAVFSNGQNGEMSRQVLLMIPSQVHQYVVDVSRARGGDIHDFYFHSHGLEFNTEGISPAQVPDREQNLYDYSGWTYSCGDWDGKSVKALSAANASGPWQATWSRIDDYRGQPAAQPLIHDDVFLRLWMVDEPGSEVIVGSGPAQRHFRNEDFGREMKIVCVRRPNTEAIDKFIAVIEPYNDRSFIRSVRRLDPGVDDGYTVALAIETIYGTDYVTTYGGPDQPSEVTVRDGGHTISTDADYAVVSYPHEGAASLLLAGGRYLRADNFELICKAPPQFTGRLLDFDDEKDTLTIESSDALPIGDVMAGQPIVVQHAEDRSSFTIKSVQALGGDRYLVHLDDRPRLFNNRLRVRSVDANGMVVEPDPVLDAKRRTYKVYAGEPGKERMLGPLRSIGAITIRNEFGTNMFDFRRIVTDDYSGIEPGQEIAITRLEKGKDTVFVTNFAHATTGQSR